VKYNETKILHPVPDIAREIQKKFAKCYPDNKVSPEKTTRYSLL